MYHGAGENIASRSGNEPLRCGIGGCSRNRRYRGVSLQVYTSSNGLLQKTEDKLVGRQVSCGIREAAFGAFDVRDLVKKSAFRFRLD